MAQVQVTNVTVLDNPTAFFNPFQFEITFECLQNLENGKLQIILTSSYILPFHFNMEHCSTAVYSDTILHKEMGLAQITLLFASL